MAEKKGRVARLLESIGNPFRRRRTPEPQMPLWTTGIQEPVLVQGITIPALYAVSNENLILRQYLLHYNKKYLEEDISGMRHLRKSVLLVKRSINMMLMSVKSAALQS